MQTLGDDIRVPRVKAPEDEQYHFIVTVWPNDGSLSDVPTLVNDEAARDYAKQMLDILTYIHQKGICHHDIKPANFLIHNGRLLLIDFAMAYMINDHENIWAVIVTLYNLVTEFLFMYNFPSDHCFLFHYLISSRALSRNLDTNVKAQGVENRMRNEVEVATITYNLALRHLHMCGVNDPKELQSQGDQFLGRRSILASWREVLQ